MSSLDPQDAGDTDRVPPVTLPDEAEPADVLEQYEEVVDPDEDDPYPGQHPDQQQIDGSALPAHLEGSSPGTPGEDEGAGIDEHER